MSIRSWSTTAASNNSNPPNGWPEGMQPSAVNNTARQMMADIRSWYEDPVWTDFGDTPTRIDNDTVTVATDLTARYVAGRRLRLVGATTGYATIASVSYSAPDTTIELTMDSGNVPASLSTISLSALSYTPEASEGNRRTAAEIAASVTPVNYGYAPGHVLRYGINTTPGTTDLTAAVQAALSQQAQGGDKTILCGNCKITDLLSVTFTGDFIIEGVQGAVLTSTATDPGSHAAILELLGGTSSRIACRNFRISHSGTGSTLSGIDVPDIVKRADFNNVEVTGARYYGCEVNATHQVHTNPSYSDNIHGGLLAYGGHCVIVGPYISNNGNGSDNTEGYGLELASSSALVLGGQFIDNDRYGIDFRHATNVVIIGPYIYNSGLYGIYGVNEDGDKDFSNCKIHNAWIDMNNRSGSSHAVWVGAFGASQTSSPGNIDISHNTLANVTTSGASTGYGVLVSAGNSALPPTMVNVSDNIFEEVDGDYVINVSGTPEMELVSVCRNKCKNTNEIFVVSVNAAIVNENLFKYSGSLDRLIAVTADKAIVKDNIIVGNVTGSGLEVTTSESQHVEDNIFANDPDTHSGAGAISLLTQTTWIVTTGANALTLADGFEGQEKLLVMKTDAGDGTLTPANLANGTTITFSAVDQWANLRFTNGQWFMLGGNAAIA